MAWGKGGVGEIFGIYVGYGKVGRAPTTYKLYKWPYKLASGCKWCYFTPINGVITLPGWWFQRCFIFTRTLGNYPIWRAYVSNGWLNHQLEHTSNAVMCWRRLLLLLIDVMSWYVIYNQTHKSFSDSVMGLWDTSDSSLICGWWLMFSNYLRSRKSKNGMHGEGGVWKCAG